MGIIHIVKKSYGWTKMLSRPYLRVSEGNGGGEIAIISPVEEKMVMSLLTLRHDMRH